MFPLRQANDQVIQPVGTAAADGCGMIQREVLPSQLLSEHAEIGTGSFVNRGADLFAELFHRKWQLL
jgi:hypothetical protein